MPTYPCRPSKTRLALATACLLAMLVGAGCATTNPTPSPIAHTLQDVPGFPVKRLAEAYKPEQWQLISHQHYTGYVILKGRVSQNGSIQNPHILKAYPDSSRNAQAVEFSGEIRVTAVTIGSRVPPTATVYVVFYETPPIRTALVFGEADATIAPTGVQGGAQQILIKSY